MSCTSRISCTAVFCSLVPSPWSEECRQSYYPVPGHVSFSSIMAVMKTKPCDIIPTLSLADASRLKAISEIPTNKQEYAGVLCHCKCSKAAAVFSVPGGHHGVLTTCNLSKSCSCKDIRMRLRRRQAVARTLLQARYNRLTMDPHIRQHCKDLTFLTVSPPAPIANSHRHAKTSAH